MERNPSGGGNFIGVLFIVLVILGIGIAATTTEVPPQALVGALPTQPVALVPDTGLAQAGELQGPVFSQEQAQPLAGPTVGELTLQDCIVQSGDTLGLIAQRHGVTVEQILALNPQVTDPNRIYPGQVLRLPHEAVAQPVQPIIPSTGGFIYTVQSGDTLGSLATRYNKSIAEIVLANPTITNPNLLSVGQQIVIPD